MPLLSGPDEIYGGLFELVQSRRLYADSKTFVDATPKADVAAILEAFRGMDRTDDDDLRAFVDRYFELPVESAPAAEAREIAPVRERLDALWSSLARAADRVVPDSSLIPLPRPFLVPGGRFREVYYWDSYFTMLGLAEAGRLATIEDMVENFAFLIDRIGFIPNGNRTYFCTRSQPPVFSLMVELLADARNDESILRRYLPQLRGEYDFWMRGAGDAAEDGDACERVVRIGDAYLNRYWDDSDRPRPESYAEDREIASHSGRDEDELYRDIRAACESGWDFSSRWLDDGRTLESIRTTRILPVDLNALLHHLERLLAKTCEGADEDAARLYADRAERRAALIRSVFFDDDDGFYFDVDFGSRKRTAVRSLASAFPLYLGIASQDQADRVRARIQSELLAPGGWLTTAIRSGQQWDRPNGWAPLQWAVYRGFRNYGFDADAELGASRWAANNIAVYEQTGRLLEKYDVEHVGALAAGGEYAVQDGFGWTNGVLLKLMNDLGI